MLQAVNVLAIETSSVLGSVSVQVGETKVLKKGGVDARHGETLLPLITAALDEAKVDLSDIDLFVVGTGPGSFTGTRIGLATAKGLVLATGKPLVGVSSFAAIARATGHEDVLVMGDGGRGAVFAGRYRRQEGAMKCVAGPLECAPEEAMQRLNGQGDEVAICGTGVRRYPHAAEEGASILDASYDAPLASFIGEEGRLRFEKEGPDDEAALEPLYVRASDAKLPSKPLKTS